MREKKLKSQERVTASVYDCLLFLMIWDALLHSPWYWRTMDVHYSPFDLYLCACFFCIVAYFYQSTPGIYKQRTSIEKSNEKLTNTSTVLAYNDFPMRTMGIQSDFHDNHCCKALMYAYWAHPPFFFRRLKQTLCLSLFIFLLSFCWLRESDSLQGCVCIMMKIESNRRIRKALLIIHRIISLSRFHWNHFDALKHIGRLLLPMNKELWPKLLFNIHCQHF